MRLSHDTATPCIAPCRACRPSDRRELRADHLGEPVGRLAGLRRERDLRDAEPREAADDRGGDQGLAGAGAAGDDRELAGDGEPGRVALPWLMRGTVSHSSAHRTGGIATETVEIVPSTRGVLSDMR
jgi:hypothetical protein